MVWLVILVLLASAVAMAFVGLDEAAPPPRRRATRPPIAYARRVPRSQRVTLADHR
jgi:hypothetical protein